MGARSAKEWFESACILPIPVHGINTIDRQNMMIVGMGYHTQIEQSVLLETSFELPISVQHFLETRSLSNFGELFNVAYVSNPNLDTISGILSDGEMDRLDYDQIQVCAEIEKARLYLGPTSQEVP